MEKKSIDFTRAFDSAWERMVVILFRPFDLGKWCVIGFSAFLAGLLSGGNGFNSSYNNPHYDQQTHKFTYQHAAHPFYADAAGSWGNLRAAVRDHFQAALPSLTFPSAPLNFLTGLQPFFLFLIIGFFFLFVLAFIVLLYWLGARGQFLFLDNIVRNRAAIAVPWTFYARPANAVFRFYLLFLVITFAIIFVLTIPVLLLCLPLFLHSGSLTGISIAGLVVVGLVYLALIVALACIIFLFREWGIPLMFRNGLTARDAFTEVMNLAKRQPGTITLFILLRIALWIAAALLSLIACCFTCCIALLPYLGTVVLLPVLIYIRCFGLDCLAQFGPAYDVWTVDVPPADAVPIPPPPL